MKGWIKLGHKTFISNKYSEAQDLRDRIIESLGEDATYYKGETSESPDLTNTSTENIKKNLKNMMYDTSVTMMQNWELSKGGKPLNRINPLV